ncbi:MAG: amidase family protein, partial [Dehalococcoidia bacterium]
FDRMSAMDYYRAAYFQRPAIYRRVVEFFETYDLLLAPTLATPPFAHQGWAPGPPQVAGTPISPFFGWLLTYPFNLTGQPAASIPVGFSDEGLPIGMQIVGRRHADAAVLRASAAFEQAAPWAARRPHLG